MAEPETELLKPFRTWKAVSETQAEDIDLRELIYIAWYLPYYFSDCNCAQILFFLELKHVT